MKLLNIDTNAKTVKGQKRGYLTGVLYLAPADLSGFEVCPQRSKGCTAACLNTAGRGAFSNVQQARIARTKWYFEDRPAFTAQLVKEIAALVRKAEREGLMPIVRLNGTSDIPWERVPVPYSARNDVADTTPNEPFKNIMGAFPRVQFYDYTKVTKRALAHAKGEMPSNYHLTFSLTEANDADAQDVIEAGGNVAVVFADNRYIIGGKWGGLCGVYSVVDGDQDDLRHLDPKGVIVGLKAKGRARRDTSGFVRAA